MSDAVPPEQIRFRLLLDGKGQWRLAFAPVAVVGMPGVVRVVLHPATSLGSSSSLRPGVETLDIAWEDYKNAPTAVYERKEP